MVIPMTLSALGPQVSFIIREEMLRVGAWDTWYDQDAG